ncbi:T9SS type A sorting domain-containing protein [Hyunsoonleella sp. SJ7]|uniref:T9SS type A sorting domain-containing protein n=1 Tax=Hyunsoonleella aquatilis TaxID=2762758 RepID=A0A923KK94_9FLAO|nr:T9SS type A sorting domain-containing protein [Hyunsoonleella aquatilis]MBC3758257.1 T9SS type A sorting domain-containing protein [Hyunsoonleella aquatilis]
MKKNTCFSILFIGLLSLVGLRNLNAQGFLREVSLKQQIEKSELVIEGKVVSKRSTWDEGHKMIYTINTVEVYKIFKGNPATTIEVVTEGGTVGLRALIVHPTLTLYKDDIGVFTLNGSNERISRSGKSSIKRFKPYGLSQGFYRYNLRENLAANSFKRKEGIADAFYNEIKQYTKKEFVALKSYDAKQEMAKSAASKSTMPPGPITLGSSTVTAGTKDVLIITGTNFGATQGKVWFRNADDGGDTYIAALDSEVDLWQDDRIEVQVPSLAGTGTIYVEDSGGGTSTDSSTLTVSYAEINVPFNPGTGTEAYQVRHVDKNGGGGYTWEMQTDFFNETEPDPHSAGMMPTGYKDAFMRAFNKWVCETGVNWTVSGTATAVDIAGIDENNGDGNNVIRFDNGDELDDSTLGKCFSWYMGCGGSTINWFVDELDIVFNNSVDDDDTLSTTETWYFGTGTLTSSQYDFESIALHELGHGHQLAHVIDPVSNGNDMDDVMHWALANGISQKELTADNIMAANGIQARSEASAVCGETTMTEAACPLSVEEEQLSFGVRIYPNPAKESFFLTNESIIPITSIEIYDVSGRVISIQNFTDDSKVKTVNMANASGGLYIIKILGDNASVTKKLVLE